MCRTEDTSTRHRPRNHPNTRPPSTATSLDRHQQPPASNPHRKNTESSANESQQVQSNLINLQRTRDKKPLLALPNNFPSSSSSSSRSLPPSPTHLVHTRNNPIYGSGLYLCEKVRDSASSPPDTVVPCSTFPRCSSQSSSFVTTTTTTTTTTTNTCASQPASFSCDAHPIDQDGIYGCCCTRSRRPARGYGFAEQPRVSC